MPLLQQAAAALARLVTWWPEAAAPLAASLVPSMAEPGLTAGEARALLPLVVRLLSADGGRDAPLAAAAEAPLVQLLAFQASDSDVHEWASHCMQLLRRPRACSDGGACAAAQVDLPGAGSLALLRQMWHDPQAARHWLASLELTLSTSAGTGGGSKLVGGREQRQLATPTLLLLCALLQHPAATVAAAAVDAAVAAASAAPLLGLTLLPLLVLQLQRLTESFLSGTQRTARPSPLLLRTLRALPLLARHPAVLPFVLRALQPLLAPSAPPLLQAVGLRLLCAMWVSTGRGFQQLRTAVIGKLGIWCLQQPALIDMTLLCLLLSSLSTGLPHSVTLATNRWLQATRLQARSRPLSCASRVLSAFVTSAARTAADRWSWWG